MLFKVCLGCFCSMVNCMLVVAAGQVRMMPCRLVLSSFVVLGGFPVMTGCLFVVLRCLVMMVDCVL
jgi:hypothetical protein